MSAVGLSLLTIVLYQLSLELYCCIYFGKLRQLGWRVYVQPNANACA